MSCFTVFFAELTIVMIISVALVIAVVIVVVGVCIVRRYVNIDMLVLLSIKYTCNSMSWYGL